MRRIPVVAALVLTGGLLAPGTALAAEDGGGVDVQHRWIAVEDGFAIVLPDGETFTEENPPPDEEAAPPVGTRVLLSETLYETEDGTTRGEAVGRTHIECTAQVVEMDFLCDIAFVLTTGSQLHGSVLADFSAQTGTEPLQLDIAVTGGTGEFSRAVGEVSLLDITNADDPAAETVTLYETDIELARS